MSNSSKRCSHSSPPTLKRHQTERSTLGLFTADLAWDRLADNFPGASPSSTQKLSSFRKLLFSEMVPTRLQESTMTPPLAFSVAGSQREGRSPPYRYATILRRHRWQRELSMSSHLRDGTRIGKGNQPTSRMSWHRQLRSWQGWWDWLMPKTHRMLGLHKTKSTF